MDCNSFYKEEPFQILRSVFKKRRCMMHVEKNSASRRRATLKKTHYLCEVKLNE